jgi:cold shock CspA family protein
VNDVGEHTRGAVRKTAPARRAAAGRPAERLGTPRSGRIVRLLIGQGHGFIRLANDREVFFHRSDLREGISFNRFAVGDIVEFELLEDQVSGPRAVQVEPRQPRR